MVPTCLTGRGAEGMSQERGIESRKTVIVAVIVVPSAMGRGVFGVLFFQCSSRQGWGWPAGGWGSSITWRSPLLSAFYDQDFVRGKVSRPGRVFFLRTERRRP